MPRSKPVGLGGWEVGRALAFAEFTSLVEARGSTVAPSGCVVYDGKFCGKKEPRCAPSSSQTAV